MFCREKREPWRWRESMDEPGFAFPGDRAPGERAVVAGCFDFRVRTLCTHIRRFILPDQEIRTRFGKKQG